jgi:hypothetical protein
MTVFIVVWWLLAMAAIWAHEFRALIAEWAERRQANDG